MARLSRSLRPSEVVVELAGKREQQFAFSALGRTLRGRGSCKVGDVPLCGIYLAFDFGKKQVRIIDPLLYADGQPEISSLALAKSQFVQTEHVYDGLGDEVFATFAKTIADLVADGDVQIVQGTFPAMAD